MVSCIRKRLAGEMFSAVLATQTSAPICLNTFGMSHVLILMQKSFWAVRRFVRRHAPTMMSATSFGSMRTASVAASSLARTPGRSFGPLMARRHAPRHGRNLHQCWNSRNRYVQLLLHAQVPQSLPHSPVQLHLRLATQRAMLLMALQMDSICQLCSWRLHRLSRNDGLTLFKEGLTNVSGPHIAESDDNSCRTKSTIQS